ncbi:MAG: hypothetical protein JNL83_20345 [Myxococcales bacterium]|nr:hypothetical protein [Myxococcales bacterium]
MRTRLLASLLAVAPLTAACTEQTVTTSDAARLIAASGSRVVVAASSETEQPSLGCGGGGDPALGPSVLFVSDDGGAHYDRVEPADARPLVRIGVKDGVFYGIAQAGGGSAFAIVRSADGRSWTELVAKTGTANDLSISASGVAVAYSQGVLSSTDGATWTDRAFPQGLWAPSVAQVGGTIVLASPEDGVLQIATETGWTRRPVAAMQSIWELIPAEGALLVTGNGQFDGDARQAIARVDLGSDAPPSYLYASMVRPVVTPAGLLDTSGQLAPFEGAAFGSLVPFVDPFQSATVTGQTVQLLRDGSVTISTDGGKTFGAPVALPIQSVEHPYDDGPGPRS